MQHAESGYSTRRNPAGLAVTVALHAGLGAAALIGFGAVTLAPPPKPPIIIVDHRDPLMVPPKTITPPTVEQKFRVVVPQPIIDIAAPPEIDKGATPTADPGLGAGTATGTSPITIDLPKPPVGETRSASIDPRYRADFEAPYPAASQRLGETGTVLVRVVVGTDGRVVRAIVARSSGFQRLDDAAVKRALTKWRFVPALRDGSPVEAEREIPVTFRLNQR